MPRSSQQQPVQRVESAQQTATTGRASCAGFAWHLFDRSFTGGGGTPFRQPTCSQAACRVEPQSFILLSGNDIQRCEATDYNEPGGCIFLRPGTRSAAPYGLWGPGPRTPVLLSSRG